MTKEEEFAELYNKWYSSFIFSAHGSADPCAKEPYNKLIEWCRNNRGDALLFIREILMEEPNDIVNLLDDLYKEEFNVCLDGFCPLDAYCNLWLNVTDAEFDGKHMKDYYKDYRKWKKYLDKHYMSWRPNLENDPNVTQEEYKQGKRNKESNRKWHDFPLSILTDAELEELNEKGYLSKNGQMKFIEELKPFYAKVKNELEKRNEIKNKKD